MLSKTVWKLFVNDLIQTNFEKEIAFENVYANKLGFSFLILLKLFSFLCHRYSSIIWCIIFTGNKEKFSLKKMSLRKLIMAYNIPSPPTVTM